MEWGFGAYLREYRRAHNQMSQDDLSALTGIKQTEISKWERGILHQPGQEKAKRFAERMGVPLAEIANAVYGVPREEFIYPEVRDRLLSAPLRSLLQNDPTDEEAQWLLDSLVALRRYYDVASRQTTEGETRDIQSPPAPSAGASPAEGGGQA